VPPRKFLIFNPNIGGIATSEDTTLGRHSVDLTTVGTDLNQARLLRALRRRLKCGATAYHQHN
jgi:hypothetical protein